jgi:hypothetical protein
MAWIRAVTVGALTAAVVGLAACGDDEGDDRSATASAKTREVIVIERRVTILPRKPGSPADTGRVLRGSKIGDSAFCPGGSSSGVDPGPAGGWAHVVNLRCPDGRLRLGFNNEPTDENGVNRGAWAVISGTGSFEGATGSGRLKVQWDDDRYRRGTETYTGTITR